MISWIIDAVIILGLVTTLAWGAVLARRIARLQSALIELAPALQAFCDAVDQTERSVEQIRQETNRMEQEAERIGSLQTRVKPVAAERPIQTDRSDLVRRFFDAARSRG